MKAVSGDARMSEHGNNARLWQQRRKLAGWVLQPTRMAKSGYAPRKAELAQWVIEASREIDNLQGRLDRLDAETKGSDEQ